MYNDILLDSTSDESVFCLSKKQGLLASDEYSNWYNGVIVFVVSIRKAKITEEFLYGDSST